MEMALIVIAVVPLVRVTAFGAPFTPTATLAQVRLAGETVDARQLAP